MNEPTAEPTTQLKDPVEPVLESTQGTESTPAEVDQKTLEARIQELESGNTSLVNHNKKLLDEKKQVQAKERTEREARIQALEANQEHKALSETQKVELQDLRDQLADTEKLREKSDLFDKYVSQKAVDTKEKLTALSEDHRKTISDLYPDWDNLTGLDQSDRLDRYLSKFGQSAPRAPGGIQKPVNGDLSAYDKAKKSGNPLEMLKLSPLN